MPCVFTFSESTMNTSHQSPTTSLRWLTGATFPAVVCVSWAVLMPAALLAATPEATSTRPDAAAPPEFAVYPPEISLDSARDFQTFVAVMTRSILKSTAATRKSIRSSG